MKYFLLALILASLIPLQSGTGCRSFFGGEKCDQNEESLNLWSEPELRLESRQVSDDSVDSFDKSEDCTVESLSGHGTLATVDCEPEHRFILPFDLFLLPIEKEVPSTPKKGFQPLLSKRLHLRKSDNI